MFTKTQEKQLDFLRSFEGREELDRAWRWDASCRNCGDGKIFASVEGARCFIRRHAGHRTWIKNLGRVDYGRSRGLL